LCSGRLIKKVLIIDDEINNHLLLSEILEDYPAGLEIFTAEFGDLGMELINKEKPDVVFVDRMLPVLDGEEICRRVKADPELRDRVKLIMISALKNTAGERECLADVYIQKPYRFSEIILILDQML